MFPIEIRAGKTGRLKLLDRWSSGTRDLVHQLGYIIVWTRGRGRARKFRTTRGRYERCTYPAISCATRGTGSRTDLTRAGANLRRSALRYATPTRTLKGSPWTHRGPLPTFVLLRRTSVFVIRGRHVIALVSRFYRDGSRDRYSRTSGPNETYDWRLWHRSRKSAASSAWMNHFSNNDEILKQWIRRSLKRELVKEVLRISKIEYLLWIFEFINLH